MEVRCPKCDRLLDSEEVNVTADTAFCRDCDEAFKLSDLVQEEEEIAVDLANPPKGAWFEETFDGFILGATTRCSDAFIMVPFAAAWSVVSVGGICWLQIVRGEFSLGFCILGIPFFLASLLLWAINLMLICGKVVVVVEGHSGSIFTGVCAIGWKKHFSWLDISRVYEQKCEPNTPGNQGAKIVLEGKRRVEFGTWLRDDRRNFVVQALRKMLAKHRTR
jgi:hypothetical protein